MPVLVKLLAVVTGRLMILIAGRVHQATHSPISPRAVCLKESTIFQLTSRAGIEHCESPISLYFRFNMPDNTVCRGISGMTIRLSREKVLEAGLTWCLTIQFFKVASGRTHGACLNETTVCLAISACWPLHVYVRPEYLIGLTGLRGDNVGPNPKAWACTTTCASWRTHVRTPHSECCLLIQEIEPRTAKQCFCTCDMNTINVTAVLQRLLTAVVHQPGTSR